MSTLLLPGDVTRILPDLARQGVKVHMVATSPPYFRQRQYPIPETKWPQVWYTPIFGGLAVRMDAWEGQLGREEDPFAFIGHLIHAFRLVKDVLRDDGLLYVDLGDKFVGEGGPGRDPKNSVRSREVESITPSDSIPPRKNLLLIPHRFALAMQADGWILRNEILWHKPNSMPHPCRDRFTVDHETIFLFSKSERYFFDVEAVREPLAESTKQRDQYSRITSRAAAETEAGTAVVHDHETPSNPAGRQKRTVWTVATKQSQGGHWAVFPDTLLEPMILASTSAWGCCATCGAQYIRILERPKPPEELVGRREEVPGQGRVGFRGRNNRAYNEWLKANPNRTTGWKKSCECPTDEVRRPVVLDIFSGEGSTGDAALRLGRDYIGIDADLKSIRASKRRLKPLDCGELLEPPCTVLPEPVLESLAAAQVEAPPRREPEPHPLFRHLEHEP